MIPCSDRQLWRKLNEAAYLWLFLDYDGTLADFAATPDEILPDDELISLISALAEQPDIRVAIISGRRLAHINALLPVPGILMAGSYGLEIQTANGETVHAAEFGLVRPLLDRLKQLWTHLLDGRSGFYLEDKGWTLAIHGKDAAEEEAAVVLHEARQQAQALLEQEKGDLFHLHGGHRFLECRPGSTDKKRTFEHLLGTNPIHKDTLPVYLGDDDKDEVAFEAIQAHEGIAVAVGERLRDSSADCYLASPQAVRQWLRDLLKSREATELIS